MTDTAFRGPRGRGRRLMAPLRWAAAVAFVLAGVAMFAPDAIAMVAYRTMIALLLAAPMGRVAFLAVRWFRLGDVRFAHRAGVLLAVYAAATVYALIAG